jgi:4-hydroxy-3-polyprenylbenzoate decarboxylase
MVDFHGIGQEMMVAKNRLVVGITGASGVILGIKLLEALRSIEIETHLVVSPTAKITIKHETEWLPEDVLKLADVVYDHSDVGAAIASGTFSTLGMVVIPCSIKSLSAIANSYTNDLLIRAADVSLKEGRPLVLVVRETPLHKGHLRIMAEAADSGATIFPPVPAFYAYPDTVEDIVQNTVGRVLARLGIDNEYYEKWEGLKE